MNKILIEYIIRLFSIISNIYSSIPTANVRDFISSFLKKEFSGDIVKEFISQYNENYKKYAKIRSEKNSTDDLKLALLELTKDVNDKLPKRERFEILIRLLLFNKFLLRYPFHQSGSKVRLSDILAEISSELHIDENEYLDCKSFIEEKLYSLRNKSSLLLLCAKKPFNIDINIEEKGSLNGQLFFLIIKSINYVLFYYKGNETLYLNNRIIFPENVYNLPGGSSIKSENIEPIFYNEIIRKFLSSGEIQLNFEAKKLEFNFKNSNNGIHDLDLSIHSGQMIGIIGRSGVGKSTLLNLLNGTMIPKKGSVTINNLDIYQEGSLLEGLIGYIPQDDLLVEELTVFKNLYLNAKLCFGNLTNEEIDRKVERLLKSLDLYDVRDLKVGSLLNKLISGGQRKRLNIALELIREPYILFADEPTSGLSSSDSEEIIQLMAEQTIKGRIVVMNIHQPSSEIFKSFDKILLLDKEGYPVYFGNPVESIPYFNEQAESFVTMADSCQSCGNVNPESIFKILEERKVNQKGEFVHQRKVSPDTWHKKFVERVKNGRSKKVVKKEIPKSNFKKPNILKQFLIFGERNILSKIANRQFVLLAFTITPFLSLILSLLCKNSVTELDTYVFNGNENIPAYLFMGVIVALFVGLIISAEDIYRDRKILKRESFLRLNKISYITSKILFLFVLSGIQSFLFVLIGNWVLGIKGMLLYHWVILFSTYCFANVTGLLISALFNSIVVIYIIVPLFIIPQILLSGTMVKYDKLHHKVVNDKYVPFVGDIMASRWAYEALIVSQFGYNKYQKLYFKLDKKDSYARFNVLFLIPEMKEAIEDLKQGIGEDKLINYRADLEFLFYELGKLNNYHTFNYIEDMKLENITYEMLNKMEKYLRDVNLVFTDEISTISYKKDSITHQLVNKFKSIDGYNEFKNKNSSKSISDMVLKRQTFEPFIKKDKEIIRKIEPIYQIPDSRIGRAQLFASEKILLSSSIDTIIFNVAVLWIMTLIFCIFLTTLFYKKF